MATVDIVTCTRSGINEEAKGPLTSMLQHANCFCRDPKDGRPLHAPWACNRGKHHVRMMPSIYGSSVVHWARNQAVAQAMYGQPPGDGRPASEYFLLMDDDMQPLPEYLSRLLSYKLDIVCGICTIRRDPPRPNIRFWNEEQARFYDPIKWDWDSQKLMEIDGAGAAFMLVKRDVFEVMGRAYLDCKFEVQEYARMGVLGPEAIKAWTAKSKQRWTNFEAAQELLLSEDPQERMAGWQRSDQWWFQFIDNAVDRQVGEIGEDLSFCWKAKKLGFRIFADPQVQPGHLGLYGYSVRDLRAQVEAAEASGVLQVPEKPNEVALVESA